VFLRCGTSQEDGEALSFTIKLAPDVVGYDKVDDEDASVAVPSAKKQKLIKQMTASDLAEAARTLAKPFDSFASELHGKTIWKLQRLGRRSRSFR
jgi:hypothetical protein